VAIRPIRRARSTAGFRDRRLHLVERLEHRVIRRRENGRHPVQCITRAAICYARAGRSPNAIGHATHHRKRISRKLARDLMLTGARKSGYI
jgi:hypothetical protein